MDDWYTSEHRARAIIQCHHFLALPIPSTKPLLQVVQNSHLHLCTDFWADRHINDGTPQENVAGFLMSRGPRVVVEGIKNDWFSSSRSLFWDSWGVHPKQQYLCFCTALMHPYKSEHSQWIYEGCRGFIAPWFGRPAMASIWSVRSLWKLLVIALCLLLALWAAPARRRRRRKLGNRTSTCQRMMNPRW